MEKVGDGEKRGDRKEVSNKAAVVAEEHQCCPSDAPWGRPRDQPQGQEGCWAGALPPPRYFPRCAFWKSGPRWAWWAWALSQSHWESAGIRRLGGGLGQVPEHLPGAVGGVLEVLCAGRSASPSLPRLLWLGLGSLLEAHAGLAPLLRWWKAACVGREERARPRSAGHARYRGPLPPCFLIPKVGLVH